jgi:hypothetical protein|tara:strand:- start:50 stop:496 length:447 start_codon:yes stop_codon:yes gene_type:complete
MLNSNDMVKKIAVVLINVLFMVSCSQPEKNTMEESEDIIVADNSDLSDREGNGVDHLRIKEYPSAIDSTIQKLFEEKSGDQEFEIYNKYVYHPWSSTSEYSGDSLLARYEGIDTSSIMVDVEGQLGNNLLDWNFIFELSGEFIMEIEQ